jgi:hypothetical protein
MKGHSIQIPLISNTFNFVFNYNSKESITQFQRRKEESLKKNPKKRESKKNIKKRNKRKGWKNNN